MPQSESKLCPNINIYENEEIVDYKLVNDTIGSRYISCEIPKTRCIIEYDYDTITYLRNIGKNIKPQGIQAKDKVFITKDSMFPSLFISKVENLDIKRTINPDNSDKIIIDESLKIGRDYNDYYLYTFKVRNDSDEESNVKILLRREINVNSILTEYFQKKILVGKLLDWNCKKTFMAYISSKELKTIINNPDKMAYTSELSNYVNQYLPEISNDDIEMIDNLISSNETTNVKLGIEILHTFKFEHKLYDIAMIIRKNYYKITPYNKLASYRHIESRLNIFGDQFIETENQFHLKLYNRLEDDENKIKIRKELIDFVRTGIKMRYKEYLDNLGFDINLVDNDNN